MVAFSLDHRVLRLTFPGGATGSREARLRSPEGPLEPYPPRRPVPEQILRSARESRGRCAFPQPPAVAGTPIAIFEEQKR